MHSGAFVRPGMQHGAVAAAIAMFVGVSCDRRAPQRAIEALRLSKAIMHCSLSIAPHCCIQYSSEIGCNIFYYMTLPSFTCLLHFAEVGNSEGQSKNISELAPPCCNHVQNCQVQLQVWPAWPAWCLVV